MHIETKKSLVRLIRTLKSCVTQIRGGTPKIIDSHTALVARYVCLLALLIPLTFSEALRFAMLALFMGSLTHFDHSLV